MQDGAGDIGIHCSTGAVVLIKGDRVERHRIEIRGRGYACLEDHWSFRASERSYGLPASAPGGELNQTLKSKR